MTIWIGWIDVLFVAFLLAVGWGIRRTIRDNSAPVDMVLHCPACGTQHIDAPAPPEAHVHDAEPWINPPHRTHQCGFCGLRWRPADVPTNGVAAVQTRGKHDSPIVTTDWTR